MTASLLLFPGQGTETPGMSDTWETERAWIEVLERAEAHTGYALRSWMKEGPIETLRSQRHAPCAVLAHSVGLYRVHRELDLPKPVAATGHSMGFYSALVAAEVIALEDALDLLRAVEDLSDATFGAGSMGMAYVIGLSEADVHAELAGHSELALSNLNGKAQFTVSGPLSALKTLLSHVEEKVMKCGLLPVQHPLHGPHMVSLLPAITRAMGKVKPRKPVFPLISHFDGRLLDSAEVCWDEGLASVALPVDWPRVVERLKSFNAPLAECGFGNQLSGLTRWADRDLEVRSLQVRAC
jgi:[acyl-carrier-protein] S-malonyltransferase